MKYILTADLHLTDAQPANRIDNYRGTLLSKFHQICDIASSVDGLLVAGDFFDRPNESYDLTREVLSIIQSTGAKVYAIPGQHDLRYHTKGLDNTPLGMLMQTGAVKEVKEAPAPENFQFYGLGWEETLPPIFDKSFTNILITHEMVTETKKGLFHGHEGFETKRGIFKKYPYFDVIISGDNHKPHLWTNKGKIQLNCGSICRKGKDQIDYFPSVWLFCTSTMGIGKIDLHIAPAEEVFNFEKIEQEEVRKELKKHMEEFIDALQVKSNTPDFKRNLSVIIKKAKAPKEVAVIINSIMEGIKC